MQNPDTLTNLFKHNLWANRTLLEICSNLTEEQLGTSIPGTFGPIKDTLQHIAAAEQSYFSRISTGKMFNRDENPAPGTVEEMLAVVEQTGTGFIEWAPKVQPDDSVTINWDGADRGVPKTTILTQVINHATEHRAQIMTTMTQLGIEPPDLSGWTYFDETTHKES